METRKTFFNSFSGVLGALLIVLLIILAYLFITDQNKLPSMLRGIPAAVETQMQKIPMANENDAPTASTSTSTSTATTDTTFTLSDAQKQALIDLGIDPATVPTTISSAQVLCFEEKLGATRVSEIRNGSVPTTFEFIKIKSCVGQ